MYKKKDGMPMMGQVGMNSVFGGPRQLDVDSLQYPYSGAMTRMDQGAIDKANDMFGPLAMRQYGMNMSGPLNKTLPSPEENPGVNKLPSGVQKKMGYTEDSSGDPLMKIPDFSGRTFKSLEGESVQTADLSKAFLSGAFATEAENTTTAQNTNEQPQGVQTFKDAEAATSRPRTLKEGASPDLYSKIQTAKSKGNLKRAARLEGRQERRIERQTEGAERIKARQADKTAKVKARQENKTKKSLDKLSALETPRLE